jgi:hypothetical protein
MQAEQEPILNERANQPPTRGFPAENRVVLWASGFARSSFEIQAAT